MIPNNYALLIGVGQRADDPKSIEVTAEDARRMAQQLALRAKFQSANITPIIAEQATRINVLRQLDGLIKKTETTPADLVVVFFSGHGVTKDGNSYLVSQDTEKGDIEYTAIEGKVFTDKINKINAKAILILLNSCHSGDILADGYVSADVPFSKADFISKPNRAIITACSGAEKAYTSTPLSVFTYALVAGLAGECIRGSDKKAVSLFDLSMYIRELVVALSKDKQHPELAVLQQSSTTNFAIVDYSGGLPDFEMEEQGGLYDALGVEMGVKNALKPDTDYRSQFEWLGKMKNAIINSNIKAGGNVHIGDKGNSAKQDVDSKNVIVGSTITSGGDFRLGDDIVQAVGNVHIGDIHIHNAPPTTPTLSTSGISPNVNTKSGLKMLLAKEKTAEVIEYMLKLTEGKDDDLNNTLFLLSSRYNRVTNQENKGIISGSDAGIERNRINVALTNIIDDMDI
jgi:Caspase domain/Effector-associated domain 11